MFEVNRQQRDGNQRSRCRRLAAAFVAGACLLVLPSGALARTLSPEPAGGGFVENPDHTWTLYGYGHVLKVYSAAEKKTFDRVWHAEEFDVTGNHLGFEVTGISPAETEAAEGIVTRLRTGQPYVSKGEREVGEGLMRSAEAKGIIAKSAETLFMGIEEQDVFAGFPYIFAIKTLNNYIRAFTLPPWSSAHSSGKKEAGERNGRPIRYSWSWSNYFSASRALQICSSIVWGSGLSPTEVCAYAAQPVGITEEWWNPSKEEYVAEERVDSAGNRSGAPPTPFDCPGDGPYPSCEESGSETEANIGEWVNVTALESSVSEFGFPALTLASHIPEGYRKLSGENSAAPPYGYSENAEPTPVSNPHVAALADELEIAYALQSPLLPGLEGEVVPSPDMPGEVPVEARQVRCETADPVSCATGNYAESQTDIQVGGRGVGLDLTRHYSAQAAAAGVKGIFGYGWSSSFGDHLVLEPAVHLVQLATAEGMTVPFKESEGSLKAPVGSQYKLSGSSEVGYTLTLPDQTQYKFQGSSGRLESVTDRDGNETKLSYNSSTGLLETITDPVGRKLTLKESAEGFVESAKDPLGREVKYTYENETLASVTLPGESSPRWSFTTTAGSHLITEVTDGRGGKTINKYNSRNQVEEQTDPMKHTLTFVYEPLQTKITNTATEAVTLEQFTPNGEPSSVTHGYGTSLATTESWEYTEAGYIKKKTDGNKHSTEYGYNEAGDQTTEKDADGNETKWEYDTKHDVISMTTPKGETTTIKREAHGNPETIERPAPESKTQTTKYKYKITGELESVEDPLKRVRKYEYDTHGNRTAEIDPESNKRTWEYNEDSQVTATVSPRGHVKAGEEEKYTTKIERDAQGRALTITDPLKHTTKYKYDGDGNIEQTTDANGHTTKYTYNSDNQPTKVEAPNKAVTETEYDGAGQIIKQIDGNKHTTKYARNVLGEVTEVTDPLGHLTKKEYDAAGNLTKLEDPAKRTTTYKYDPANRLEEASYSSGKPATITYEYDKDGDRTKMVDGTGTTKYTYDQLDRLTQSENGHKEIAKYEYDLANERTKITYPNGKAVTRTFDKDGRLEKVTDWNKKETKFSYDQDSELKLTAFPSENKDEDKYTYNEADQMTEVKMDKSTEVLASLLYTRDNDGQVKKTTAKGLPGSEITEATYDENNRLGQYGTTEYKYDAADNPTKAGSVENKYNEADELEKAGTTSYTYDELGERTKQTPEKGPATTYGYDQAGNLTSLTRPEGESKPKIEDTYTYDGNNLRASQTINGTTSFLAWDMAEGIPVILSDGTNSYIYGPGGQPFEQINNSTGTTLYLHSDQQGSTRILTGKTGKTEGKCTYNAYGTPTCEGTATTPLGYDAQYTSTDTGLIYLRARVYDPASAQFLSVDPLTPATRAPYNYTYDNPLNATDPTGLLCFELSVQCATEDAGEAVNVAARVGATVIHATPVGQGLQAASEATGATVGVCAGGALVGGGNVHASACYIASPNGGSALTYSGGGGAGGPIGVSGYVGVVISNAQRPSDVGGQFYVAGGSYGEGAASVGGSLSYGQNSCGRSIWQTSLGWTPSASFPVPVSGYGGVSYTVVYESY